MIPEHYRRFVYLNPVAPLMINWRNLLLNGSIDLRYLAVSIFYAALTFAIGYAIYKKLSDKFAEVI